MEMMTTFMLHGQVKKKNDSEAIINLPYKTRKERKGKL